MPKREVVGLPGQDGRFATVCPIHPEKSRYLSRSRAKDFIREKGKKHLRPYQCNGCGDWHLTSTRNRAKVGGFVVASHLEAARKECTP